MGLKARIPQAVLPLFWAGMSAECFLDGPLLVIAFTIGLPLLLQALTASLARKIRRAPRTVEKDGKGEGGNEEAAKAKSD